MSTSIDEAPFARRVFAQELAVAPVVITSSTSRKLLLGMGLGQAKAFLTFEMRFALERWVCDSVAAARFRRLFLMGILTIDERIRPIMAAWLNPRSLSLDAWRGIGIIANVRRFKSNCCEI